MLEFIHERRKRGIVQAMARFKNIVGCCTFCAGVRALRWTSTASGSGAGPAQDESKGVVTETQTIATRRTVDLDIETSFSFRPA